MSSPEEQMKEVNENEEPLFRLMPYQRHEEHKFVIPKEKASECECVRLEPDKYRQYIARCEQCGSVSSYYGNATNYYRLRRQLSWRHNLHNLYVHLSNESAHIVKKAMDDWDLHTVNDRGAGATILEGLRLPPDASQRQPNHPYSQFQLALRSSPRFVMVGTRTVVTLRNKFRSLLLLCIVPRDVAVAKALEAMKYSSDCRMAQFGPCISIGTIDNKLLNSCEEWFKKRFLNAKFSVNFSELFFSPPIDPYLRFSGEFPEPVYYRY
eukprot:IDg6329t1